MATVLGPNGVTINGVLLNSPPSSIGMRAGKYTTRQNPGQQTSSSYYNMWNAHSYFYDTGGFGSKFNKKASDTTVIVTGQCIGMDAYSYPYGGTALVLTHSDGTRYVRNIGSTYNHVGQGNHTVYWKATMAWTASDLGNKTGDFNVSWEYGASSGSGNEPWEGNWNPSSADGDSRTRPQGSTTAVYELKP